MAGAAEIRMQQRRGTASEWASLDPVLMAGEFGLETDTGVLKIGDGVKKWSELDPMGTGIYVFESEGEGDEGGGAAGGGIAGAPEDGKAYVMQNGGWVPLSDFYTVTPGAVALTVDPKMYFKKVSRTACALNESNPYVTCIGPKGSERLVSFDRNLQTLVSPDGETWSMGPNMGMTGARVESASWLESASALYISHSASTDGSVPIIAVNPETGALSHVGLKKENGQFYSGVRYVRSVIAGGNYAFYTVPNETSLRQLIYVDATGNNAQAAGSINIDTTSNIVFNRAAYSGDLNKFLFLGPAEAVVVSEDTLESETAPLDFNLSNPQWIPHKAVFVAVAYNTRQLYMSNDGLNWLPVVSNLTTALSSVRGLYPIPELGLVAAYGSGPQHCIWMSYDLNRWFPVPTEIDEPNAIITSLAYNGGAHVFVAMPYVGDLTDNAHRYVLRMAV